MLHVSDRQLYDEFGNPVFLTSINCHRNERRKDGGIYWTVDDVKRIKENGGNCVELHAELLHDWMPTKDLVDNSYFVNWLDNEVSWCEQYGIYYIINLRGFDVTNDWMMTDSFLPRWLWEGLYPYTYPPSASEAAQVIIDFLNTDDPKQEDNRRSWYDVWKFLANRYKNNDHFLMGLMNEPFVTHLTTDTAIRQRLGRTYYTLMAQTVDAIRSVGSNHVVFIDHARVGGFEYHVNDPRPNTVIEAHAYISGTHTIGDFKGYIDNYVDHYYVVFNMPLHMGEYGFFSPSKPAGWKSLLQQEVDYLDTKPIVGRQWHCWSHLYGEYWSHYTAAESEEVLRIVLGGYAPTPTALPFTDNFADLTKWTILKGTWGTK